MIIEFVGLPGSGKSTILNLVIKGIENDSNIYFGNFHDSNRSIRALKKIFSSMNTVLRAPVLSSKGIYSCMKAYNFKFRGIADVIKILYLTERYRKGKINFNNQIWVFDQGLIQACWSIKMFGNKSVDVLPLFDSMIENLIIIKSNPANCLKRLNQRDDKSSRLQQGGANYDSVLRGEMILDDIIDSLVIDTGNILFVDNNDKIENAVSQTKDWLKSKIA